MSSVQILSVGSLQMLGNIHIYILVRDGAKFKNEVMGDMFFFNLRKNKHICHTDNILCLRSFLFSFLTNHEHHNFLYILIHTERLFLAAPLEYVHPGLDLGLD